MPAAPPTIAVDNVSVVSFAVYMLVVVAIGVWAVRGASGGMGEYFLAGRRLGRVVVALSAVVSGRSGWLLLSVTGLADKRMSAQAAQCTSSAQAV